MSKKTEHIIHSKIIVGCIKQDGKYQKMLYTATVPRLYNVVLRIVSNHDEVQDVLQESYMKIFQKITQYDDTKGKIYSWMCKICINTSINHIKRNRLVFENINELYIQADRTVSTLEQLEAEYLLAIIQKLPEQQRIIFNLYEIEGYNHKEIAHLLKINVNSCRTYLSRAKSKLQQMIKKDHFIQNSKSV